MKSSEEKSKAATVYNNLNNKMSDIMNELNKTIQRNSSLSPSISLLQGDNSTTTTQAEKLVDHSDSNDVNIKSFIDEEIKSIDNIEEVKGNQQFSSTNPFSSFNPRVAKNITHRDRKKLKSNNVIDSSNMFFNYF